MQRSSRFIRWFTIALFILTLSLAALAQAAAPAPATEAPAAPPATLRAAGATHNILIGSAATPWGLNQPAYANLLAAQFSLLEPENQMKFEEIHPRAGSGPDAYNFVPADQLAAFAAAHKMLLRGHCFVWHSQISKWVREGAADGSLDAAKLSAILQQHIQTVGTHYAGKVYAWDVVNEAFEENGTLRSSVWFDKPGIGFAGKGTAYMEQAFRWARVADPAAKLFYNDYNIETLGPKADALYAMVKDFKTRGVPIDGVGFQLHVGLWLNDPAKLASFAANVMRFNDLGLEIHFTELDVALDNNTPESLKAQADTYRYVARVCAQTPNCKLFQTWGFTDKYSWIPGFSKGKQGWALPFDKDYAPKPAVQAIIDGLDQK